MRLRPHQRAAVAVGAGRQAPRGIALQSQRASALQHLGRRALGRRRRRRVGHLQGREVAGDLEQIGVAEHVHHVCHQPVVAPSVAEVQQLVVQIAGGLAGQPRVVAVGPGAALVAMAGGAGQRALGDAVFKRGGGIRTGDQHEAAGQRADDRAQGLDGAPHRHDQGRSQRAAEQAVPRHPWPGLPRSMGAPPRRGEAQQRAACGAWGWAISSAR